MEKFYKEPNAFLKNIYINDNSIMASDEDYADLNSFLEKLNAPKKAVLDTHEKIEYAQIVKLVLHEEENGIQIFYTANGKEERTYITFTERTDSDEVLQLILSKNTRLTGLKETKGSKVDIVKPLLLTIAVASISFALTVTAAGIEAGETIRISGGKRGLKMILVNIAETLGFWGCLALSVVVTGYFGFRVYKAYIVSQKERQIYII